MKKFTFLSVLTLLLCMASTKAAAYDFAVENADGVTIYYNYINDGTEAEVTRFGNWDYPSYSGKIDIPETVTYNDKVMRVTSIGFESFFWCRELTSVTIPNSVTSIGDYAFCGCSRLGSIIIPYSVTSIGKGVFAGCNALTSIVVDSKNSVYDSRDNCNAIIETASNTLLQGCNRTMILNSVTSIGEAAFEEFYGLTSVNIPNSVTSIGEGAFQFCTSLTYVTIPNSVTNIDNYAFRSCNLRSVTIPNSVTNIGEVVFEYCRNLASIVVESDNSVYDSRENCDAIIETASNTLLQGCNNTIIPNSVTSIGDYAFSNLEDLTSITIPNGVTSIGKAAFYYCESLTSVDIPNSVTSIGDYAFNGCYDLSSITIPNSMKNIGNYAFQWCESLTSVYSSIETPFTISYSVFYNIADDATLYVPQGTKSAYEVTEGWPNHFANIVEFNATAISEATSGQSTEGDAVYSLNGMRVKRPAKGIYIRNGKKVMMK